jgi:thiamine biosynthesis lipoprotein ApbE
MDIHLGVAHSGKKKDLNVEQAAEEKIESTVEEVTRLEKNFRMRSSVICTLNQATL